MRPQRWGREPGGRARSSLSPAAAFTRSASRRPSARSAHSRASASCFSRVGLLSDHRRFELHERNGIGRRRFGMQIDKIAQMEKARDAVLVVLLSRLDARLVWSEKRRHASHESVADIPANAPYKPAMIDVLHRR